MCVRRAVRVTVLYAFFNLQEPLGVCEDLGNVNLRNEIYMYARVGCDY